MIKKIFFSILLVAAGFQIQAFSVNKVKSLKNKIPEHMLIISPGGYWNSGAAYSQDGKKIFVGTGSHLVVCDADTGAILARHKMPEAYSVELSKDGKKLLCAGRGRVIQWDIDNSKVITDIKCEEKAGKSFMACYSADNKKAICTNRGILYIYDLKNGRLITKYKYPDSKKSIKSASPSVDNKGLYITLNAPVKKSRFKFYDYEEGKISRSINVGHHTGYKSFPSPNGKILICSAGVAAFLDAKSEKLLGRSSIFHSRFYYGSFLPDGRLLAASRHYFYLLDTAKCNYVKKRWLGTHVKYIQASPDGKYFCFYDPACSGFGQCRIADGKDRKNWERSGYQAKYLTVNKDRLIALETKCEVVVRNLDGKITMRITNESGPVTSLAVSADGKCLMVGSLYGTLDEYNLADGKHLIKIAPESHRQSGPVREIKYFSNGQRIACISDNGVLYIRNVNDGSILKKFRGHIGGIFCLDISLDNKRIITGGFDQYIREWDIESGAQINSIILPGHTKSICYLPNNLIAAAGKYGLVKFDFSTENVFSGYSGNRKKESVNAGEVRLSLSADYRYLLLSDGNGFNAYCIDGKCFGSENIRGLDSMAFMPDGRFVTGRERASYDIWEIKNKP